jgi:hypothetical protein
LVIDTVPLFTPQNEFVSDALVQSTAFVAAAVAAATAVPRRTQLRHTSGGTGCRFAASVPPREYSATA